MCANCGVDPLASNKGFWAELLGFGDFYYELGVHHRGGVPQLEAENGRTARAPRPRMAMVLKRRGTVAAPVSEDDVLRAIDRLKVLGGLVRALHRVPGGRRGTVPDRRAQHADTSKRSYDWRRAGTARAGSAGASPSRDWEKRQDGKGKGGAALSELVKRGVALVGDGDPGGRERLFWIPCVSPQMTSR